MPDYTVHFGAQIEKLRLQMQAIECVVAALPGAAEVDFEEIENLILADLRDPMIDNVSRNAQERWARIAVQRVKALAAGNAPPAFD